MDNAPHAHGNAPVPRQVRWLELNVDRIVIDAGVLHRDWVNAGMCDNDKLRGRTHT